MKIRHMIIFAAVLFAALFVPMARAATADQSVGKPVTFSVSVATGTPPFTYQWRKDGIVISGATGATYSIAAVQPSDAGTYSVLVANKAGQTVSDNGVFTITVNPGGATVSISTP